MESDSDIWLTDHVKNLQPDTRWVFLCMGGTLVLGTVVERFVDIHANLHLVYLKDVTIDKMSKKLSKFTLIGTSIVGYLTEEDMDQAYGR